MLIRLAGSLLAGSCLVGASLFGVSEAQITTDGSLGPALTLTGPSYAIGSALGTIKGTNLFHSFGQFSVLTGESATFTGPSSIQNVIGRVTGGNQSFIDGLLQSTISGANLFLLNPAGVLFGPNATLDVSGSFHVSTADYLKLADGGIFHASLANPSVLTVAPPSAFGFLGASPAAISVEGSVLEVGQGKTLSLVGGDIAIVAGTLRAPSGQINLASVRSAGEVTLSPFALGSFQELGSITLSQGALVETSGDPGGTVVIRGGSLLVDASTIASDTLGTVSGAPVGVDIQVTGALALESEGTISSNARAAGNAGNVILTAGQLSLGGGAQILSEALGRGAGGNVIVTATDSVSISGVVNSGLVTGIFADSPSSTPGAGRAGNITVTTGQLTLADGGEISSSTFGGGAGGDVTVTATGAVSISGTSSASVVSGIFAASVSPAPAAGRAGNITVTTGQLTLVDGGEISSSTFGGGAGGDVTVIATGSVSASGVTSSGIASGIFADQAATTGTGSAGNITVTTGQLTLVDGGEISSITFGSGAGGNVTVTATGSVSASGVTSSGIASGIFAATTGTGSAGNITVTTGQLTLADGGEISSSTFGSGAGGNVTVTATGSVAASGVTSSGIASGIFASSESTTVGAGAAGNITVTTGQLILSDSGTISSSTAGLGAGGNVTITASDATSISGSATSTFPSGIFTDSSSTVGSAGRAGDITVTTGQLTVSGNAIISSRTFGGGAGGAVSVTAEQMILTSGGEIDSSTFGAGAGGNVTVGASDSIVISGSFSNAFVSGIFAQTESTAVGAGRAGDISVTTGQLNLSDSGEISSSSLGPGTGGNVTITTTGAIAISGPSGAFPSGIFASTQGSGNAGDIMLTAGQLSLTAGGRIDSSTSGAGRGGTVTVSAGGVVSIAGPGSGLFTDSTGSGVGGDISVTAGNVLVSDGGAISAGSSGTGNAGNIVIVARDTFVAANGSVTTEASQADGGNIELRVGSLVHLTDSRITASVGTGTGSGGNITIDPEFLVLNASEIRADAFGGPGGNVRIVAGVLLASPDSVISASSALGVSGTVTVQTSVTEPGRGVAPLPKELGSGAALLRERCAPRVSGGSYSSFVVGARGGVPLEPGGLLPSPFDAEMVAAQELPDAPALAVPRTALERPLALVVECPR